MKFGQVDDPSSIDFTLPPTPQGTVDVLQKNSSNRPLSIYVGCAQWNKTVLKGFYPRGTKDELTYYATHFNAIEFNSTFYHSPSKQQVEHWRDKTPDYFKFFPKIPQSISHYSRLINTDQKVAEFVDATVFFEEKLGMAFLQLIDNYKPKDFERLAIFLRSFPKGYPLAVELRNEEWFTPAIAQRYYSLLEETDKTNIITDTPGRRDLLHMRLTNTSAFVRFVSTGHPSDITRLDEWIERIVEWKNMGLENLYFFIHQQVEIETPFLASHFIEKLNSLLGLNLLVPQKLPHNSVSTKEYNPPTLF